MGKLTAADTSPLSNETLRVTRARPSAAAGTTSGLDAAALADLRIWEREAA